MANAYANVYMNNPTEGGTDGTAVSTGGAFISPISFELDAEQNESKTTKCAIRTETGYVIREVTIKDSSDVDDRFKLCKTENGTFSDEITFEEVTNVNSIFYVKASSANTERPQTQRSVKIAVSCKLSKV